MWIAPSIELTNEERVALEARVRAHKTPQRAVERARIVLLAAGGMPNRQIAIEVEMSEQAVGKWRQRFERLRLKGLEDAPGRGRPRRLGHEERLRVVAKATQETPEVDSQWSHASLSQALAKDGVRISPSQVGRILADTDVKPHRVQGWLNRKDTPEFWERAADVCGLYLNCPENAVVLSVDEKTAMVAREPKAPTKAPRPATLDAEGKAVPGTPARKEFEYRRHGTASIVAALDVHSGNVMAEDVPATTRSTSPRSWLASTKQRPRSTRPRTGPCISSASTWSWTTVPVTPPRPPRRGWPSTLASSSTTHPSTRVG